MTRVENTVFLSYRSTNACWALAIAQRLTRLGFDVFVPSQEIATDDFERVILENILARTHFIVLLTPSLLERCEMHGDRLRREIEAALETRRHMVPLVLEGFDLRKPAKSSRLAHKVLKAHPSLTVSAEYFDEAMTTLCDKFLNVPRNTVLHPTSELARRTVIDQQAMTVAVPPVIRDELATEEWFERGVSAGNPDEAIRWYTETLRLNPDFMDAYYGRGRVRAQMDDLAGALDDYTAALRLKPDHVEAYYHRGLAQEREGRLDRAREDYAAACRLKLSEIYAPRTDEFRWRLERGAARGR
ncbi:MAG: tetratricopeptide repeat protein [Nitrospira sp.]